MRRARRPARRGSRGLRQWSCRRRGGRITRPAYSRRRSLLATGAARNRVSSGGQPNPSQRARDRLQVAGPVGEDKAVPAPAHGGCDVGGNLLVALVAGDEVLMNESHPAGCGRAGASGVAVRGRVDVQHRRWAFAWCASGQHVRGSGGLPRDGDGVADRGALHTDQVVELVAPVRGSGQPEPAPGRPPSWPGRVRRVPWLAAGLSAGLRVAARRWQLPAHHAARAQLSSGYVPAVPREG
jgi:hypothetical protein